MSFADLEFPEYDIAKDLQAVDDTFQPIIKQAEELAAFSQKRLKEIAEEIKTVKAEQVLS